MKNKTNNLGKCKLTHNDGKFIKSHLIPQALTKPEVKGKPLKQMGEGLPEKRFNSSWYDQELVTIEGENILTEYDTAAVNELRKLKLIWSSFKEDKLPRLDDSHLNESGYGIRLIKNIDYKTLRLFILSLLWRACTTKRIEFESISIPKQDLEIIRLMLLKKDDCPIHFYPIKFCQLSTKGKIHNHSPITDKFKLPIKCEYTKSKFLKIIRFYFDGLIIHVHLSKTLQQIKGFNRQILGYDSQTLVVTTVPYEDSYQKDILESITNSYSFNDKTISQSQSKHPLSLSNHSPLQLYPQTKKS